MKNLNGKTAVITGAARGMGRSLSKRLLQEGCRLAMVDLDEEALGRSVEELSSLGDCRGFVCDITRTDEVIRLAGKFWRHSEAPLFLSTMRE